MRIFKYRKSKQKIILTSFILYSFIAFGLGQPAKVCGFNRNVLRHFTTIDHERNEISYINHCIKQFENIATFNRGTITIPIVFHVLWHTESENVPDRVILDQLEILNECFNGENVDINQVPQSLASIVSSGGMKFCLAQKDSLGTLIPGIIRKKVNKASMGISHDIFEDGTGGSTSWDTHKFINIRIVNTGNGLNGYSSFPGIGIEDYQGIVIHPAVFGKNSTRRYNLGRTLVHEMGHYFGLFHPWGYGGCNEDEDDEIEDTPVQNGPYFGCPDFPQISCGSEDIFITFMDYVDDSCMKFFTKGQMDRMLTVLKNFRSGLINSSECCVNGSTLDLDFVKIYPNPAKDIIMVDLNETVFPAEIKIIDVSGKIVSLEKRIVSTKLSVDISSLQNGIYILNIGQKYGRFMKH